MFATLFVLLYVAHLISDYPLQTDHQAAHKAAHGAGGWRANLAHAGTHFAVSSVLLMVGAALLPEVELPPLAAAGALLWISATHAVIDRRWPVARWMRFAHQEGFAQHGGSAHVDQAAHVVCLAIAAAVLAAL